MNFYISPFGRDEWTGLLEQPNETDTDGPFATIQCARDAVRLIRKGEASASRKKRQRQIHVWLRAGTYRLDEPLCFGPEDSGQTVYSGYAGEQAVIDGGIALTVWREEWLNGTAIWTCDVPEYGGKSLYFRQLFVNGKRRERARLPKQGMYRMTGVPGMSFDAELFDGSDSFYYREGDISAAWSDLQDVEIVVPHFWTDEHMPIESVDERSGLVKSSRRSIFALKDDFIERYPEYYVSNVFEALSEPGEWYLSRSGGKVYYIPMSGETLENSAITAPVAEQLLLIAGEPDDNRFVKDLVFRNLVFRHTEWRQLPGGGEPIGIYDVDFASSPQAAAQLPGAVSFTGARQCGIEQCVIEHIGWYGIEVGDGCDSIRIVGNKLCDLGAGGVKAGGSDEGGAVLRRTSRLAIEDNVIVQGGRVFHSATAILLMHTIGNRVRHNEISDFYYTGISCGWTWGYGESVTRYNVIEHNHIYNLGHGLLSDMGGIYLLGVQPGTVIRGNYIHDIYKKNYGGWGIYLDEGSSFVLVENNVCCRLSSQAIHLHYGKNNTIRNNILAFGGEGQAALTRGEEHLSFTFQHNVVIAAGKPCFCVKKDRPASFASDYNLFWDTTDAQTCVFGDFEYEAGGFVTETRKDLRQWSEDSGNDRHSIAADPGMPVLTAGEGTRPEDFMPPTGSPVFAIGFKPIDIIGVGPRATRYAE